MIVLGIDPGIRGVGVGLGVDGVIRWGGYVRNPCKSGDDLHAVRMLAVEVYTTACHKIGKTFGAASRFLGPDALVIEFPQAYKAGLQKGDQNDLPPLAAVDGAIAALFGSTPVTTMRPRDWKGTMPGDDFIRERILPRLSREELESLDKVPASLAHNMFDGVGLALKGMGRLEPHRVIVR